MDPLELIRAALAERDLPLQKWIDGTNNEMKDLAGKLSEFQVSLIDLGQQLGGLSEGGLRGGGRANPLLDAITKTLDAERDAFMSGERRHMKIDIGHALRGKAVNPIYENTDPNQFPVAPQWLPRVFYPAQQKLRIRDLLPPPLPATSGSIEYVRELTFQDNADYQVNEGDLKAQSDMSFEPEIMQIVTIAHSTLCSTQVLSDSATLMQYLQARLMYGLKLKEDRELLSGSGAKGHLSGLLTNATAFAGAPAGTTPIDAVRMAITIMQNAGHVPDGLVLNPTDAEGIDLVKSTTGEFITDGPSSMANSLWQVPLVVTPSMPAGQFLLGDFANSAQLFDREDANLQVSREDRDNFVKNMVTILVEERLALTVPDPTGLLAGPFNAPAAPLAAKSK